MGLVKASMMLFSESSNPHVKLYIRNIKEQCEAMAS